MLPPHHYSSNVIPPWKEFQARERPVGHATEVYNQLSRSVATTCCAAISCVHTPLRTFSLALLALLRRVCFENEMPSTLHNKRGIERGGTHTHRGSTTEGGVNTNEELFCYIYSSPSTSEKHRCVYVSKKRDTQLSILTQRCRCLFGGGYRYLSVCLSCLPCRSVCPRH